MEKYEGENEVKTERKEEGRRREGKGKEEAKEGKKGKGGKCHSPTTPTSAWLSVSLIHLHNSAL